LVTDAQLSRKPRVVSSAVARRLRSSSALVATVVPILTTAILSTGIGARGATPRNGDSGNRASAYCSGFSDSSFAVASEAVGSARTTMSVKVPPRSAAFLPASFIAQKLTAVVSVPTFASRDYCPQLRGDGVLIDRGGTFTDIVARRPDGLARHGEAAVENPEQYADAAIAGIRLSWCRSARAIPVERIAVVKMGTTVATNALLERKGAATALLTTPVFATQLRIGYQDRPHIFARHIVLPELLYARVREVHERIGADGAVLVPIDASETREVLQSLWGQGLRSVAIVFMHGFRHTQHERIAARIARQIGYTQVSVSHEVSP